MNIYCLDSQFNYFSQRNVDVHVYISVGSCVYYHTICSRVFKDRTDIIKIQNMHKLYKNEKNIWQISGRWKKMESSLLMNCVVSIWKKIWIRFTIVLAALRRTIVLWYAHYSSLLLIDTTPNIWPMYLFTNSGLLSGMIKISGTYLQQHWQHYWHKWT